MSEIKDIADALAKAQAAMSNPTFDSKNPHFGNRFASLAAVRNAVVPVLAKHGISLTQNLETRENGIACTTLLTHSSGQQMVFGPLVLPTSKADAQGFGSAATYARRYSIMAVAGVVGDDDDDAEAAVTAHNGHHKQDNKKAKEYADRFAEAVQNGIDGAVYDIHQEITTDEEFYRQVWSFLPSGMRRQLKEIIEREKATRQ
jgi:ERF superfamily